MPGLRKLSFLENCLLCWQFFIIIIIICFLLSVLISSYRQTFGQNVDTLNANDQLHAVELLKKEFKQIRAIWSRQSDLVHVYDEIRMAKSIYDITAENASIDDDNAIVEVSEHFLFSTFFVHVLSSEWGLKNVLEVASGFSRQ